MCCSHETPTHNQEAMPLGHTRKPPRRPGVGVSDVQAGCGNLGEVILDDVAGRILGGFVAGTNRVMPRTQYLSSPTKRNFLAV